MTLCNPCVPSKLSIKELKTDDRIYIKGVVRSKCGVFSLNLETGVNIAFHMAVRFNCRQVACNTQTCNVGWGPEENPCSFPFCDNKPFEIVVYVQDDNYQVFVDGAHYTDYNHRLCKEEVRDLVVKGEIELHAFVYHPSNSHCCPPAAAQPSSATFHPAVPFNTCIAGGLTPNKIVRLVGVAVGKRFTVNLQSGRHNECDTLALHPVGDIGLHCDVHFDFCSGRHEVVRNSFINHSWGCEERGGPPFSVCQNSQFEMDILVHANYFTVVVNGVYYAQYFHRMSLGCIDHLNIRGDVQLLLVQVY